MATSYNANRSSNRTFGLFFAALFFVLTLYGWLWASWGIYYLTALIIGALFFLLSALIAPSLLAYLNQGWYLVGLLLGKIVSPIVLGLIFFIIITPVAIFLRLIGRDALRLKRKNVQSHWIDRAPPGPDPKSYKDQFWGISMSFLKELLKFLSARKKLWLLPIIIIMVVLGGLLLLAAKSSVVAPFIYTLF